jgi:hypothetical protein
MCAWQHAEASPQQVNVQSLCTTRGTGALSRQADAMVGPLAIDVTFRVQCSYMRRA